MASPTFSFHTHDLGQGPPLVIIHGFLGAAAQFAPLVGDLESHYRCLLPDLPGHGATPWDISLHTLIQLADALNTWLSAREPAPVHLLGHSLGGYIAAAWAVRHPHRIRSLTFLHSSALADAPERKKERDRAVSFVQQNGTAPYVRGFLARLFHDPDPAWTADALGHAQKLSPEAVMGYLRMMRDRRGYLPELAATGLPIRYIAGPHDAIVPRERNQREVTALPGTQVISLAEAGHMGMYEAPTALAEALKNWWKTVERKV